MKQPKSKSSKMKHPNPKRHLIYSLIKSGLRMAGYVMLGFALTPNPWALSVVGVLILSEVLGVIEEFA